MTEAQAILIALPRKLGSLIGQIPEWFFSRTIQILLDGIMAVLAVLSAYMLRFDCDLHLAVQTNLLIWVPVLAMFRPMALLVGNGYDSTWRFFHLNDAVQLALLAFPVSLVVAVARWLGESEQPHLSQAQLPC